MSDRIATRHAFNKLAFNEETHAGLWLDRFVRSQSRDDKEARRDHVAEVAKVALPPAYTTFYDYWQQALVGQQPAGYASSTKYAAVVNRMAVGLGAESVLETAVALHHTYGVPYIPGSALKGLAAAYTRQFLDPEKWGMKSDAYETLFGTTEQAGYVTFYDALFVPGTGKGEGGMPLMPDVITVHHQEYYQGNAAPAEWDSPNPVPFLTATGTYLLALAGPEAWVKHTFDLLEKALLEMGVGAKTSTGYGRMRFVDPPTIAEPNLRQSVAVVAEPTARPAIEQGTIITGQQAKQFERISWKGERIKVRMIQVNRLDSFNLPPGVTAVFFVMEDGRSGGFRGEVVEIDASDPKVLRVLLARVKKASEGATT